MKIALIHHWYPAIGGTEKYVTALAHEYKKLGHDVFIISSKPKQRKTAGLYEVKPKSLFNYILPRKKSAIRVLKEIQPDIIHVQSPHPYASLFALYAKKLKIPVISTFHAPVNPSSHVKKIIAWVEHRFYGFLFDKIIVTTIKNRHIVESFYPAEKIEVIGLGIDNAFFKNKETSLSARKRLSLQPDRKYILFVGQMDDSHYYKGIPELISCAARTAGPKNAFHYLLIGEGNKKTYFQEEAARAKCDNIQFLGNVKQDILPLYFKAADLFVLPSTSSSEGYGIVLLEALASGTKIIASSFAGSADELKDFTGWCFITNIDDLTSVVMKAVDEKPPKSLKLQRYLEQHSWPQICKKTLKVYNETVHLP